MIKIALSLILLIMGSYETAEAQKVKNGSFNLVLKTLLSSKMPTVTVAQVMDIKDIVFIDCREMTEYTVSHISGALPVGYEDFDLSRVKSLSKDARIVAYCSIGKRSENITRKLIAAGFTNTVNLYGGIFEWVNLGNPVYDTKGIKTNRVHAYTKFWGGFLDTGEKIYN